MSTMVADASGHPIPIFRDGTTQTVVVEASANPTSSGVGGAVNVFAIVCTVNCHYTAGPSGTAATTSDAYLPANVIKYVGISPGEVVSVIKASGESDGTAYITEGL